MKLLNIQSPKLSFAKTPILKCSVKNAKTQQKHDATLYKMDINSPRELEEVMNSEQTKNIARDFYYASIYGRNDKLFYVLQDDKTDEIVSCAQTSRHYRGERFQNTGFSTMVEEAGENRKYVNGAEPLLAGVAKEAQNRYDSTIYTAFGTDEISGLKNYKFAKVRDCAYLLPEKRYNTFINQAQRRYQIEYLV